jgi:hypothetical protein
MRRELVVLEDSRRCHVPGSLIVSTHPPNLISALMGGHLGVEQYLLSQKLTMRYSIFLYVPRKEYHDSIDTCG